MKYIATFIIGVATGYVVNLWQPVEVVVSQTKYLSDAIPQAQAAVLEKADDSEALKRYMALHYLALQRASDFVNEWGDKISDPDAQQAMKKHLENMNLFSQEEFEMAKAKYIAGIKG